MSTVRNLKSLFSILVLSMFLLAGTGYGQSMMEHHTANIITTQGRGEATVQPDSLGVSIAVETQEKTLAEARALNSTRMTAILNAIRSLNIPNLRVETRNFNVHPVYDHRLSSSANGAPRLTGFRVSNNIQVTVNNTDMEQLGDNASRILDSALAAGANQINSLSFYREDMAPAQALALQEAVRNARTNAEALAQAAGVTLDTVHSIEGHPQFHSPPMPMRAMTMESAASTPIEVGEITVNATATMRYRF